MMTDRPILFSGAMVRALLAGTKTQTRRVINPQPPSGFAFVGLYAPHLTAVFEDTSLEAREDHTFKLPFTPKDRLYVREEWRSDRAYDDIAPSEMGGDEPVKYSSDGFLETWGWPRADFREGRRRASMHMPRWASRITLVVAEVRVQRLQEITPADAIAEGIPRTANSQTIDCDTSNPCDAYRALWDSLNADRGFGWDTNPWVTATTFTVHKTNIDAMGEAA
jgi:hypothetical protein